MKRVFIIGPGGAGKTTCGEVFAGLMGYAFVDLDLEFMTRMGHIGQHIEKKGYLSYCRSNAKLFYTLIEEQSEDTVFILSSGFLIYEDIDPELATLKDSICDLGCSMLLLPSRSYQKAETIILSRQMSRGIDCQLESEQRKIRDRFPKYYQQGDIQIFSAGTPTGVAKEMKVKYMQLAESAPSPCPWR